jgi:WD40 repeat protein
VAFSPDNKTVAIGRTDDGSVSLIDSDGNDTPRPVAHTGGLYALMSLPRGDRPDDRIAFAGTLGADFNVHIHEAATGKELAAPIGHLATVLSVAGSPDGTTAISGGYEGQARLWDLDRVAQRHAVGPGGQVSNVGFHPDGKQAFYCGNATANVPFLDVETGKPTAPPYNDRHTGGGITNAVVSEDGHYVISAGSADGSVRLWNLMPGRHLGQQMRAFRSPTGGSASVSFSPDGKRALWTVGTSLKLLHLRCLEVRKEWAGGSWNTFLPDAQVRHFAVLGGPTGVLWDVSEDQPKEAGTLRLPLTNATPGDVSRDGRRLATVIGERAAVWDMKGEEKPLWEWTPPRHFGYVRAVALSPDGRYLFTANGDGTVYVIQLP